MAKTGMADRKTVDAILKSLLLLGRAVEEVLGSRAVAAACNASFSPSKVRMLKLITYSGKQSVGQVARFLGVSDPAASQLAEALVRQKLITRNTDPNDRRTAYLRLTPAGKKVVHAIEQEQRHRVRQALRAAGGGKLGEWDPFLQKVTQSLCQAEQSFEPSWLHPGSAGDSASAAEGNQGRDRARRAKRTARRVAKSTRRR
jgi:DNA-binding MarR family transcriptional regulator